MGVALRNFIAGIYASASFRLGLATGQFKRIQRTANPLGRFFADVRIPFRRSNVTMPQLVLNVSNVRSAFQQMCCKRMAQRVKGSRFMNACFFLGVLKDVLCGTFR